MGFINQKRLIISRIQRTINYNSIDRRGRRTGTDEGRKESKIEGLGINFVNRKLAQLRWITRRRRSFSFFWFYKGIFRIFSKRKTGETMAIRIIRIARDRNFWIRVVTRSYYYTFSVRVPCLRTQTHCILVLINYTCIDGND